MRNGKGSTPRRVDMNKYNEGYDRIFGSGNAPTNDGLGWRRYRRIGVAEMRPFDPECESREVLLGRWVSISEQDLNNGSPKPGDMIARNPANHDDEWLVSAEYFAANFAPVEGDER